MWNQIVGRSKASASRIFESLITKNCSHKQLRCKRTSFHTTYSKRWKQESKTFNTKRRRGWKRISFSTKLCSLGGRTSAGMMKTQQTHMARSYRSKCLSRRNENDKAGRISSILIPNLHHQQMEVLRRYSQKSNLKTCNSKTYRKQLRQVWKVRFCGTPQSGRLPVIRCFLMDYLFSSIRQSLTQNNNGRQNKHRIY